MFVVLLESRVSTSEQSFMDILQDRRYWVIHLVTIPSLFLSEITPTLSGFVYKLFGVLPLNQYFTSYKPYICIINDRFSALDIYLDSIFSSQPNPTHV